MLIRGSDALITKQRLPAVIMMKVNVKDGSVDGNMMESLLAKTVESIIKVFVPAQMTQTSVSNVNIVSFHTVGLNSNQPLCQSPLSGSPANNYGFDADKVPRYTAGETVRVVWPAKNHANYECFNFIPDTSMKLFFNPNVNPTQDLANSESTMIDQGYELVKDWHDGCTPGEDGCGMQSLITS